MNGSTPGTAGSLVRIRRVGRGLCGGRNWFIMGVCDVQMRVGVLRVYVCVDVCVDIGLLWEYVMCKCVWVCCGCMCVWTLVYYGSM